VAVFVAGINLRLEPGEQCYRAARDLEPLEIERKRKQCVIERIDQVSRWDVSCVAATLPHDLPLT